MTDQSPPQPTPTVQGPAVAPGGVPPEPVAASRKGFPIWTVVIALLALVVGVGIGYAASVPSHNDLQSQRDSLQTQLTDQQAARDKTQQRVTQLEKDVADAKGATSDVTKVRDVCSKAAGDGSDLIAQYNNLLGDMSALMQQANAGVYDADLVAHLEAQSTTMDKQSEVVNQELKDCQKGVGV